MIVCLCKGITDRAVRQAARAGATSVSEVGAACAAATECGGCQSVIDEILCAERCRRLALLPETLPFGSGAAPSRRV